jgi:hypothetical protein
MNRSDAIKINRVADDVRGTRSAIAQSERAKIAGTAGGKGRPKEDDSLSVKSADKLSEKTDSRASIAKETNLPERKIRLRRAFVDVEGRRG